MAYYTTEEIINIAKASEVVTSRWLWESVLWRKGALDPLRALKIRFVRKSVEYYYDHDPNYDGLYEVALFLLSLCPVEAYGYVTDGGQITPVNPPSMPYPAKIEFDVDGSTFIPAGENTVVLPVSWTGFDVMLFRNGVEQRSLTSDPTYMTYNINTRTLFISPNAVTTEPFSIRAV